MAKATRKTRRRKAAGQDAIALLKADHREIEGCFERFLGTRSGTRKLELARKICAFLKAHTRIEEEIFYPAFLEATRDRSMHHEAEIEHLVAKKLIVEIESSGPADDYYDARVEVLSEMIKHHVEEEEGQGGMFAKARRSGMDLEGLGKQLKARKNELMNGGDEGIDRQLPLRAWHMTPEEAGKESFPASDPPATGLPDKPPVNADAKWKAAEKTRQRAKRGRRATV